MHTFEYCQGFIRTNNASIFIFVFLVFLNIQSMGKSFFPIIE